MSYWHYDVWYENRSVLITVSHKKPGEFPAKYNIIYNMEIKNNENYHNIFWSCLVCG